MQQFTGNFAFTHHNNAVGDAQHLGQIAGGEQDRHTAFCQFIDDVIDFVFRPHVDTAGWFIQQNDLHVFRQPAPQYGFLLVAAGQVHDQLFSAGGFNVQRTDMVIRVARLPAVVNQASRADKLAPGRDVDVVAHRVHRNNAFGLSILRAEHNPRVNRLRRLLNIDLFPVDENLALGYARPAKQPFHQLAAPCPHEAKQPDDFAAAHRE